MTGARWCEAYRYAPGPCNDDSHKWDVVYRGRDGAELDRHPACMRHGLAEVDRHRSSGGIAQCAVEPAQRVNA